MSETPLNRLEDAVRTFFAETGTEADIDGFVLAASTSRIDATNEEHDLLPLVSGQAYAIGGGTSVTGALGLAGYLDEILRMHLRNAERDE